MLLVSELASNAILHAVTDFEVMVHVTDDGVRVEVTDSSRSVPTMRPYAPDAVSGRGMHIVATTADRWGCEPQADGKVVWFELDR